MEKRPLIPHILTKKPTSSPSSNTAKPQPTKRPAEIPTEKQESNFFSLGQFSKADSMEDKTHFVFGPQ